MAALAAAKADPVQDVIARARAFAGPEERLSAVRSVHFAGTLEASIPTPEGPRSISAKIEIIFQAPFRHRIVVTFPDRVETTALDDLEAWQKIEDPSEPTRWRLTLLSLEEIKRLRASTWENLSFYRGIESRGGSVTDRGQGTIGDTATRILAFDHGDGIVYVRHFDAATGQLLLTETDQGEQIREQDEFPVDGIRFFRKVITSNKLQDGSERVITVTFDRIVVNREFPLSSFAMPPVGIR